MTPARLLGLLLASKLGFLFDIIPIYFGPQRPTHSIRTLISRFFSSHGISQLLYPISREGAGSLDHVLASKQTTREQQKNAAAAIHAAKFLPAGPKAPVCLLPPHPPPPP